MAGTRREVLLLFLLTGWRLTLASYTPLFGREATIFYNVTGEFNRFPDVTHISEDVYDYFISELNFDAISNRVLAGAANKLYLLNTNLTPVSGIGGELAWETDPSNVCSEPAASNDYGCQNHIRVYKKMATSEDHLFVCGTQSAAVDQQQCTVIDISTDVLGDGSVPSANTQTAQNGLISYYPEFTDFGEFRRMDANDDTYFTASFFSGGNGIGRHFSISYQRVFLNGGNVGMLTMQEESRTIDDWLIFPFTFVDYYRAEYSPSAPATDTFDYRFYFIFIREEDASQSTTADTIYSRVVRICQNDAGFDLGGEHYFVSFMKARIFCQQEVPAGREFIGSVQFQYNALQSMVFNEDGRYYEGGTWQKMMYGAFSGPTVGPEGTAICAYQAENTQPMGDGFQKGIFDIFREDLIDPLSTMPPHTVANMFTECVPGRSDATQAENQIEISPTVLQIGDDPLLVLEGISVTQMVLDRVCVVRRTVSTECRNQDVLFLGTDTGKILKVVFGSDGPSDADVFPVIAEEISLDDGNAIEKLKIVDLGGTDYLYANTFSKLYRIPLERCSRHSSCSECIGSRDPYCVWNTGNSRCEINTITAADDNTATVPTTILQNIHTGVVAVTGCTESPVCNLIVSARDYTTIQVEVQCNFTDMVQIMALGQTMDLDLTSDGGVSFTGAIGLHSYTVTVTTEVGNTFTGPQFTATTTTPPGPPVTPQADDIYVDDITANSLRVTLHITEFTDYFDNYEFRVNYTSPSSSDMTTYQSLSDGNSVTITGLQPAETVSYTVEVKNNISTATSASSSVLVIEDVPGAVQSLMMTGVTDTTVTIGWVIPTITNGNIDGYSVSVNGEKIQHCTSPTSYTVTGLDPFVEYTFSVKACTDAGEGAAASVMERTLCGVAERVQNFQFNSVTQSTMSYSWSQPSKLNGDPATLQYTVERDCYNPIGGIISSSQSIATTSGSVSGLEPQTYCCVTVFATTSCSSGNGLPVQLCQQTSDTIPGEIRNLQIEVQSSFSLLVEWSPPTNYERPGLNYTIEVIDSVGGGVVIGSPFTVVDRTSYYVGDDLNANTEYTVRITAASGLGSSMMPVEATAMTLPPLPPAPQGLNLTIGGDGSSLVLTWEPVGGDFSVEEYRVFSRCNEVVNDVGTVPGVTSTINVTDPGTDFAWCTAQVQAVSDTGRSNLSELAEIVVPPRRPSKPRCFLVDDFGSSITISFDVSYPFSLDDLSYNYTLTSEFPDDVDTIDFNSSSSNILQLSVSRNTRYDFELSLCNRHGCSDPCEELRNFTTSVVSPRPPTNPPAATDITCCSATVTWEVPLFENAANIKYSIQLSSSKEPRSVSGLIETNYDFINLTPDTEYSVAVRVTDTDSNIEGLFGPSGSFRTLSGIPSEPRYVGADYNVDIQELRITWTVPETTNGSLTLYEVHWSNSTNDDCETPNGMIAQFNQTNIGANGYVTTATGNVNTSTTILCCVRAHTRDEEGIWGFDRLTDISVGGQRGGSDSEDCEGLIAVAVVAGVAVLSTLVVGILLAIVIHMRWKPLHKLCSWEEKSGRPSLQQQSSVGSTLPLTTAENGKSAKQS